MSDTIEPEIGPTDRRRRKSAMWWNNWLTHPLSDEDFFVVYAAHLFATTPDRDVTRVRDRVFGFVRNHMHQQWGQALATYRQEYPL